MSPNTVPTTAMEMSHEPSGAALFSPLLQQSQYWCYFANASKDMAHGELQELHHSLRPPSQLLQWPQNHPPQPQGYGAAPFSPLLHLSQYWHRLAYAFKNKTHGEFQELLHSLGPPPQPLQHQRLPPQPTDDQDSPAPSPRPTAPAAGQRQPTPLQPRQRQEPPLQQRPQVVNQEARLLVYLRTGCLPTSAFPLAEK